MITLRGSVCGWVRAGARFAPAAARQFGARPINVKCYDLTRMTVGGGTGTNPVREKFEKLARESDAQATRQFVQQMEELSAGLNRAFPSEFDGAKRTVDNDLKWMNQKLAH